MSVVYKIFEYVLKYSYEENSDFVFRYVWLILFTEVFMYSFRNFISIASFILKFPCLKFADILYDF